MTKLIQDKTQFWGGWLLVGLGCLAILLFVFDVQELNKIPNTPITGFFVVVFGGTTVMILAGNDFIEKGLTDKGGGSST